MSVSGYEGEFGSWTTGNPPAPAITPAAPTSEPSGDISKLTAEERAIIMDGYQRSIAIQEAYMNEAIRGMRQQRGIAGQQMTIAGQEADRASTRWRQWQNQYWPKEKEFIAQAFQGISPQAEMDRAGQGVIQAFDKNIKMAQRDLTRIGIDPSSPKYAALLQDMTTARAAAEAGARNEARRNVRDINFARKQYVVGLGKGIPSEAASMASAASPFLSGASSSIGTGLQGVGNASAGLSGAVQGLANTQGDWLNARTNFLYQGALSGQDYNQRAALMQQGDIYAQNQIRAQGAENREAQSSSPLSLGLSFVSKL